MALSGSFEGSIQSGHYKIRVDWSATQNVANNTSTITAKLYFIHDWSLKIVARSSAHSVTIDGTTTTMSSSAINSSSGTIHIGTATKTVTHNADGTRSVAMSALFALKATLSGTYYSNITASASITLDTIARASKPTLSTSSVDMGSEITISTNRASSSFKHTLEYTFGSASGTIANDVGASYTWKVPYELATQHPKATSGTGTITCKTYNGSTLIGTETVDFTAKVPSNVVPSIMNIVCSDPNGYASTYGGYVQSKSKVKITVNATGVYGSTIKSYKIELNGNTYTANKTTTGVLTKAGDNTITAIVTDSRGRTATKSTTISVLAYSKAKISKLSAVRCLSDGTEDNDGAYMKVTVGASITSLSNQNSKSFELKYKQTTESKYTTAKSWTTAYSVSTSVVIAADINSSYDIQLTATDAFGKNTANTVLGTSFVLLDFNASGGGLAFGKVSERDAFESALDTYLTGQVSIGGATSEYKLTTSSFLCADYVRTRGATGWYNATYAGGWYQKDSTWVRIYNDKNFYTGGTIKGGEVITSDGADLNVLNNSAVKKTTVTFGSWGSMAFCRGNGTLVSVYVTGVYIGNSGDTLSASAAILVRILGSTSSIELTSPEILQKDWGIVINSAVAGYEDIGVCVFTSTFKISAE